MPVIKAGVGACRLVVVMELARVQMGKGEELVWCRHFVRRLGSVELTVAGCGDGH